MKDRWGGLWFSASTYTLINVDGSTLGNRMCRKVSAHLSANFNSFKLKWAHTMNCYDHTRTQTGAPNEKTCHLIIHLDDGKRLGRVFY